MSCYCNLCTFARAHAQILNRTNNIFELVTVEPVPERLENHNRDILGVDLNLSDLDEHNRNLRLKGKLNFDI